MSRTILITAVLVALTACGNGSGTGATRSPGQALTDAICRARSDAARGETAAANREYYDHAHQPLHELAAELQRKDRSAAATLLEAHQRVEDDLATEPPPRDLADHLAALADQARDAVAATGGTRPEPCPT